MGQRGVLTANSSIRPDGYIRHSGNILLVGGNNLLDAEKPKTPPASVEQAPPWPSRRLVENAGGLKTPNGKALHAAP